MITATQYIDTDALWKVLVIGIVAGAGVVALFATGVRAMSRYETARSNAQSGGVVAASATTAAVCFLVCLAAVAYGIVVMFDK